MFERHAARFPRADARPPQPTPVAVARSTTPRIDSSQLLAGGQEVLIDHAGQEYRLRLTRNDKLILTK